MYINLCTWICIGFLCMFRCITFQLKMFSSWIVSNLWMLTTHWQTEVANSKTIQHTSLQKQDPSLFRETAVYTIDSILRHCTHKKDKARVEQVLSCRFRTTKKHSKMGVSKNNGTPKSSIIIHFNRVFHYKPSILEYPYFWKHPKWRIQKRWSNGGDLLRRCGSCLKPICVDTWATWLLSWMTS